MKSRAVRVSIEVFESLRVSGQKSSKNMISLHFNAKRHPLKRPREVGPPRVSRSRITTGLSSHEEREVWQQISMRRVYGLLSKQAPVLEAWCKTTNFSGLEFWYVQFIQIHKTKSIPPFHYPGRTISQRFRHLCGDQTLWRASPTGCPHPNFKYSHTHPIRHPSSHPTADCSKNSPLRCRKASST
jgi:hypothetical protein